MVTSAIPSTPLGKFLFVLSFISEVYNVETELNSAQLSLKCDSL